MRKLSKINLWLSNSLTASEDKRYYHRLMKRIDGQECVIIEELRSYVREAHADAIRHLRNLAGISLDPLDEAAPLDPAEGYPECLHIQTLKGYFGEILSGIVAENLPHFGISEWKVPAFLFRFHNVEFDQLERLHQIPGKAKKRPGRTGDDNLAFFRDRTGKIVKSLACEAKCTANHETGMIDEAHIKVSEPEVKPVSIRQIIEILMEYDDPASRQWVNALRQLWLTKKVQGYERCDLVCYTCGRSPVQKSRYSWISATRPHSKYKGGRRLEVVEIHLEKVDELIKSVYMKKEDGK